MFHKITERAAEFFKTGFFLVIYNLPERDITYASSAGPADLMQLDEASAKVKFFITKEERWKNFNSDCRGLLRCGHDIWSVASKDKLKDEAICAYLVLRLAKIESAQEWVDLVRSARKNQHFIRLNEFFIQCGHDSVLYRKN